MDIGDCAGCQVDVEAQQVKVLDRFKFNGVTKEILANECLDSWVGQKIVRRSNSYHRIEEPYNKPYFLVYIGGLTGGLFSAA